MAVNYNDKRFTEVNNQKNQALTELEKTYSGMINNSDKYYQAQIDASKQWADTQSQIQKQETDFAIQQVEQQKEQTTKDYTREQQGAYVDWQKQSSQHGVQAEQKASQGLQNTGYSESSQVSMYNTYQNRVATARESYNTAIQNYNNSITQARLQNNAKLAEIAYQALQSQLELSLQGFQYKNQLVLEKANKKTELENQYYQRYQNVLQQINTENALAEQVRQFNAEQKLKQQQLAEEKRQYNATLAEQKRQFNVSNAGSSSGGGGGGGGSRSYSGGGNSPKTAKNGKKYEVQTEYYKGSKNKDCKQYGTFSNGYQPKGISGYGKVSKTGDSITISTQTLSGKKQKVVQNVWKTPDGSKWYWEGRQNKYIKISSGKTKTMTVTWDKNGKVTTKK